MLNRSATMFALITLLAVLSLFFGITLHVYGKWAWTQWPNAIGFLSSYMPSADVLSNDIMKNDIFSQYDALHKAYEAVAWPINILSALIAGIGAWGTREALQSQKRLNGTWYFVSTVSQNDRIARASKGEIKFRSLQLVGKRHASELAQGKVTEVTGKLPILGEFHATEIVIGNTKPYCIYLEWYYIGSDVVATTKIRSAPINSSGERPDTVTGIFVLHNIEGSGKTYYFKTEKEAQLIYQNYGNQINQPA